MKKKNNKGSTAFRGKWAFMRPS